MGTDDKSGPPMIWTPSVIDGEGKPEPKKAKHTPGSRPAWHIEGTTVPEQTEFSIRLGDTDRSFKLVGTFADAVGVINALSIVEKVERNAMRLIISTLDEKHIVSDPTLSLWGKDEKDKLTSFFAWLQIVGQVLLGTGRRPWSGKYGEVDEGENPAKMTLVKPSDEGGNADKNGN